MERMRQLDADLIVMDIDSPEGFAAALRLLEAAPAGVIALAENPSPRWVASAIAAGIAAILSRSVMVEEMRLAFMAADAGLVLLHPGLASQPVFPLPASDPQEADGGENLSPASGTLTSREREILRLVSEGLGNREIAGRLTISEHTVKFHVSSILGKLGAGSRTEAVSQGIRRGLIPV